MPDQSLSLDDIHRLIGQLTLENALLRKIVAAKTVDIGTNEGDNRIRDKVLSDTKSNPVSDITSPPPSVKGNGRPYDDDEQV